MSKVYFSVVGSTEESYYPLSVVIAALEDAAFKLKAKGMPEEAADVSVSFEFQLHNEAGKVTVSVNDKRDRGAL